MIKKLKSLNKKEFFIVQLISYAFYFVLMVLAPTITVFIKYDLFKNHSERIRIDGWAFLILVCIAVVACFVLKRLINKLDELKPASCYLKIILTTITSLVPFIIAFVALGQLKVNFDLALTTFSIVLAFFIAGTIEDTTLLTLIDREDRIRREALLQKEAQERINKI